MVRHELLEVHGQNDLERHRAYLDPQAETCGWFVDELFAIHAQSDLSAIALS